MAAKTDRPRRSLSHSLGMWLKGAVNIGDFVAAFSITIMMFAISADVIRRAITGRSIGGVLETSEVLLVFIVFLGLGYTQSTGAHVATSALTSRLQRVPRRVVQAIGLSFALIFLAWAIYATGTRAWDAFQIREYRFGLLQVPIWPGRIAVVVGLALWFLEVLRDWILILFSGVEEPLYTGLDTEDLQLLNSRSESGDRS